MYVKTPVVPTMAPLASIMAWVLLQNAPVTVEVQPVIQIVLSVSSVVSIGLGFYGYGRLTERVKTEQERRIAIEGRVTTLEQTYTKPEEVERLTQDIQRLTRIVWRIAGKLKVEDDRDD